jgi:hypothetical protein
MYSANNDSLLEKLLPKSMSVSKVQVDDVQVNIQQNNSTTLTDIEPQRNIIVELLNNSFKHYLLDNYIVLTSLNVDKWTNWVSSKSDNLLSIPNDLSNDLSHIISQPKEELKSVLTNKFECEVLLPHTISKLYFEINTVCGPNETLREKLIGLSKCIYLLFDIKETDPNYNLDFSLNHTISREYDKRSERCTQSCKLLCVRDYYHILVTNIKINSTRRRKLGHLLNVINNNTTSTTDSLFYNHIRTLMPKNCNSSIYNDVQAVSLSKYNERDLYDRPLGCFRTRLEKEKLSDKSNIKLNNKPSDKFEHYLITDEGPQSYNDRVLTLDRIKLRD